jgi:hypothetical protein
MHGGEGGIRPMLVDSPDVNGECRQGQQNTSAQEHDNLRSTPRMAAMLQPVKDSAPESSDIIEHHRHLERSDEGGCIEQPRPPRLKP